MKEKPANCKKHNKEICCEEQEVVNNCKSIDIELLTVENTIYDAEPAKILSFSLVEKYSKLRLYL